MFWKTFLLAAVCCLLPLSGSPAAARSLSVEIITDSGQPCPVYPVGSRDGSRRAYVEARLNARYGIRITNHTGRRLGLVVAVDGRNIISGNRSHLSSSERMYVLDPYSEAVYDGWRTSRDYVSRFYFTSAGDSYAGAWDDYSAMGVIAVAAYAERRLSAPFYDDAPRRRSYSRPGTGFGEKNYSPTVRTEFWPESKPLARHFLKYEWRETLCRKNVIACQPQSENRFWDDEDFWH
ncbi:hypothetical protein [Candidatus Electronema sp. JC]|uniref:hypothetical protein n=1 Tax=Candidatus Electronema sp. JC TaxID=3401570 RepID=UPI003B42E4A7